MSKQGHVVVGFMVKDGIGGCGRGLCYGQLTLCHALSKPSWW